MARNPNAMRGLSIAHIVIGILMLSFGIADRVLRLPFANAFVSTPSNFYFGIGIGVWICITGIMGIIASGRERTATSTDFTGVFLGFSIVSALLTLAIIGSYGYTLAVFWPVYRLIPVRLAIAGVLSLLGIAEFIIVGIWAAVFGCQACCDNTPPGQVIMAPNTADYVTTQGADGVPVAVPVQAGGVTQGIQPPMMMTSTGWRSNRTT